jgi:hypothetical protein
MGHRGILCPYAHILPCPLYMSLCPYREKLMGLLFFGVLWTIWVIIFVFFGTIWVLFLGVLGFFGCGYGAGEA